MATDSVLQVRIDSKIKNEAEIIFGSLGLTFADAVRIFAIQAIENQGFPFEVTLPKKRAKVLHAAGIASQKADSSKIELEKTAWARAMREKYEIS